MMTTTTMISIRVKPRVLVRVNARRRSEVKITLFIRIGFKSNG